MKYARVAGLTVMLGLNNWIWTNRHAIDPDNENSRYRNHQSRCRTGQGLCNPSRGGSTANLYLDGKIDQWYSQQNGKGVVFILNVTDLAAAHEMLEKLPLCH